MTTGYGAVRARQVRAMLWVIAVVALLATVFAALVVVQEAVRFGLFVGVPAVGALAAALVAVRWLDADRPARPPAAAAGVLTTLVGLVTASLLFGFVVIILGVLMVLVAVLPEPRE